MPPSTFAPFTALLMTGIAVVAVVCAWAGWWVVLPPLAATQVWLMVACCDDGDDLE